jgi:hypothetical protein
MAQLDDAAHETVLAIHSLEQAIGDAREACADALAAVEAQTEALDADRAALAGNLDLLESALAELSESVAPRVAGARSALAGLAGTIGAVGPATGALRVEADGIGGLSAIARDAQERLTALAEATREDAAQAVENAAAAAVELERHVDEGEQFLSVTVGALLTETRERVDDGGQRGAHVLQDVCIPRVEQSRTEWGEKEPLLIGALDNVFADMRAHAETLVLEAGEAASAVLMAAADDAVARTEASTLALADLAAAAAVEAERSESPELPDALADASADAEAAAARVEAVRDRWRAAGFGA